MDERPTLSEVTDEVVETDENGHHIHIDYAGYRVSCEEAYCGEPNDPWSS